MLTNLISLLKQLELDDSIQAKNWLSDGVSGERHPLIEEIEGLANELLITNKGSCNWEAIKTLTNAGYPVSRGEADSFGWLSGKIKTNKGFIVYG